jgi:guanosine-3',5'-bis(diphosphate) 3'-pyrophosphohydrolase
LTQEYDFLRCDYSREATEKYLREIVRRKYNDVDLTQIFDALALADQAHGTQLRYDGVPFIIHPMRVALLLLWFDRNITCKVFIADLLHDTLEKTHLQSFEIEAKFDMYVTKLVQSVTRHDSTQNLQENRLAKLQNWREILLNSHEVRAIKTFEDLDNIICWKAIPERSPCHKKIHRWLDEARELSLPLARATNIQAYHLMCQEYMYYVKRGYGDQPITS